MMKSQDIIPVILSIIVIILAAVLPGLLLGLLPTMAFLITVRLAARAGMKLVPMIASGYGVWAIGATAL